MKRIILSLMIIFAGTAMVSAQTFEKGAKVASVGVGFGSHVGVPVVLSYEYGVHNLQEDLSIGIAGVFGYGQNDYGAYKGRNIILAAKGNIHYNVLSDFDFYAGLSFGYNIAHTIWDNRLDHDLDVVDGKFLYGAHIGARYYFIPNLAVNSELGYGVSIFSVGLSYKF